MKNLEIIKRGITFQASSYLGGNLLKITATGGSFMKFADDEAGETKDKKVDFGVGVIDENGNLEFLRPNNYFQFPDGTKCDGLTIEK